LAGINIIYIIYNVGKIYYFGDIVNTIFKSCQMVDSEFYVCTQSVKSIVTLGTKQNR